MPAAYALPESTALKKHYAASCQTPSDIFEYLPVLKNLSCECPSAVEIGVRGIVSTWGILQELSENKSGTASYIGIDIVSPPKNSLHVEIPYSDLLFINSLHTYVHLTAELERYCDKIDKYIALHDTSDPWGDQNEAYHGNYSEYPEMIDKSKEGLWQAVVDFLERHPEWELEARYANNHGFTILRRIH